MKNYKSSIGSRWLACAGFVLLTGCGGSSQQSKDKEFFTSGNREADQRADQRMAQQQELTGTTSSGGVTTKSNAVLSTDKKSLYDRIGGEVGINLIVNDFVPRALDDPRVNLRRVGVKKGGFNPFHRGDSEEWANTPTNVRLFKLHMSEFLSLSTGGPTRYTGEDIKSATKDLHITNPEFDAADGDLKATLDKLQIANQEQKELLSVTETLRDQMVTER